MFDRLRVAEGKKLVKFTNPPFDIAMLDHGRFRVSPASSYKNTSYNDAMFDDELRRRFVIPCFADVMAGRDTVWVEGQVFDLTDGDLYCVKSVPDYYMFCTCLDLDPGLPADFDTSSALVIHDPDRFNNLVVNAVVNQLPDWKHTLGGATYYDPYTDYEDMPFLEMTKHFAYAYQKEHRIVWYSEQPTADKLHYLNIEIGPMKEYAEIVRVTS